MKRFIIPILLLISFPALAQLGTINTYRAINIRIDVSEPTTPATDSTWNITADLETDQLAQGYNGTQIEIGDRIVDQYGNQYKVDVITSASSETVALRVIEIAPTPLGPTGNGVIFDPAIGNYALTVPANSAGISTATLSRLSNHNLIQAYNDLKDTAQAIRDSIPMINIPEGQIAFGDATGELISSEDLVTDGSSITVGDEFDDLDYTGIYENGIAVVNEDAFSSREAAVLPDGFSAVRASTSPGPRLDLQYTQIPGAFPTNSASILFSRRGRVSYPSGSLVDIAAGSGLGSIEFYGGLSSGNITRAAAVNLISTGTAGAADFGADVRVFGNAFGGSEVLNLNTYSGQLALSKYGSASTHTAGATAALGVDDNGVFKRIPLSSGSEHDGVTIVGDGTIGDPFRVDTDVIVPYDTLNAAVDSSYVRNDSVFISFRGQEFYTGINRAVGNPNTIYVDQATGNDATGEIGYEDRAFETIGAAIDSAIAWDVTNFVVKAGVYTETTILDQRDLVITCEPGVTFSGLRYNGLGKSVRITGLDVFTGGNIWTSNVPGQIANFHMEVDSFHLDGMWVGYGFAYVKARTVTNPATIGTGDDSDQITLKMEVVNWNMEADIMYASHCDSVGVNIEIDNLTRYTGAGFFTNWQQRNVESTFRIAVGKMVDAPGITGQLIYFEVDADTVRNSYYEFDIGAYKGNSELMFYFEQLRGEGSFFNFNCDYCQYNGTNSALWNKSTGNRNLNTNMQVIISGNYVATQAPIWESVSRTNNSKMKFKGRFETKLAAHPVFELGTWNQDANSGLDFDGAILINDGTVAPITVTGATSIRTMNTYANSTVALGGSITQLIESMVQNASVR